MRPGHVPDLAGDTREAAIDELPDGAVDLAMAWDPATAGYACNVVALKVLNGEEITVVTEEPPQTQIIDLMAALKASLEGGEAAEGQKKPASRAGKKPAAKKSTKKKAASG